MEEKQTTTARAILFTQDDHMKEYIISEKQQILIGAMPVEISCDETGWNVDVEKYQGEIYINGNIYTKKEHILNINDRDILQFIDKQITDMVLEKTEASDLQWKNMPLTDCFPIIHIRRAGEVDMQAESGVQAEMNPDDIHEAEIRLEGSDWILSDIHTVRGIFINGKRIFSSCTLKQMDVIQAGDTLFFFGKNQIFYSHTIFHVNGLCIHIEERTVRSFFKKHILLQDINLSIEPGNMVLLLGGSGAGKTTFINAITGYEKAKAQILQDGMDVYENYGKLKHSIGFVPQQDLLREDDTVRMTLENAAQMRLPKKYSQTEREARVEKVLEMFGLSDLEEELVRKLSGGQRKRLSICEEFISDPKLFLLDEPDSGLDGVMAKDLMENLRVIADQNKIVMVITHTPDRVIDLFDKVIVLAKGTEDHIGHLAFFGGIEQAREFFGKETMEEIVLAVNGVKEGGEGRADEFIQRFKSINPEEAENV